MPARRRTWPASAWLRRVRRGAARVGELDREANDANRSQAARAEAEVAGQAPPGAGGKVRREQWSGVRWGGRLMGRGECAAGAAGEWCARAVPQDGRAAAERRCAGRSKGKRKRKSHEADAETRKAKRTTLCDSSTNEKKGGYRHANSCAASDELKGNNGAAWPVEKGRFKNEKQFGWKAERPVVCRAARLL